MMKCKVYSLIYWCLPTNKLKSMLIEKHFLVCEKCRTKIASDFEIKKALIKPDDLGKIPDLWPDIRKNIGLSAEKQRYLFNKKHIFLFPGLHWAAVALVSLGFLLLLSLPLFKTKSPEIIRETSQKILIKSIKLNNHPAKTFFFQSAEPNRLIVWVKEKK